MLNRFLLTSNNLRQQTRTFHKISGGVNWQIGFNDAQKKNTIRGGSQVIYPVTVYHAFNGNKNIKLRISVNGDARAYHCVSFRSDVRAHHGVSDCG